MQRLVDIFVEHHGILPGFINEKADRAILHFRNNSAGKGKHLRAFYLRRQTRHGDFQPNPAFEIEVCHGCGGGLGVRVPNVFVIDHHVAHKQVIAVGGDPCGFRAGHGHRPFIKGQKRRRFLCCTGHSSPGCQQYHKQQAYDGRTFCFSARTDDGLCCDSLRSG